MTSSISWVDPNRWNELLQKAGFEPVESAESETSGEPVQGFRATVWIERLLGRAAGLSGAETAFLVDRDGGLLARTEDDAEAMQDLHDLVGTAADLIEVLETRRRRGEGPSQGMAIVALGGPRRLHVVEAERGGDRFGLGVVASRTLSDRELVDLRLRLGQALG